MSTTPPDTEPTGPDGPAGDDRPLDAGPRVTRDEARELGRIRRSVTDRKVAGVAAGVARHFDVDPLLVRVAFVLLAVFGGGGILAYVAGWLLIPEEGSDDGTIRTDDRTRTVLLAVAGAIAAFSLVGDSFGGWDFPWPLAVGGLVVAGLVMASGVGRPHPGPLAGTATEHAAGQPPGGGYLRYVPPPPPRKKRRGPLLFWFTMALAAVLVGVVGTLHIAGVDVPAAAYPATVLATCGVMLLVGAFYGRAGGLIFIGLVAALATAAAAVVDDVSAGEVRATPQSAAALQDRYDLGVGEIRIDLTEIEDLSALDGESLGVDLQVGRIVVIVPEDGLDVEADAHIDGAGHARVFDDEADGDVTNAHDGVPGYRPLLTIDAEVDFGEIEIYERAA